MHVNNPHSKYFTFILWTCQDFVGLRDLPYKSLSLSVLLLAHALNSAWTSPPRKFLLVWSEAKLPLWSCRVLWELQHSFCQNCQYNWPYHLPHHEFMEDRSSDSFAFVSPSPSTDTAINMYWSTDFWFFLIDCQFFSLWIFNWFLLAAIVFSTSLYLFNKHSWATILSLDLT